MTFEEMFTFSESAAAIPLLISPSDWFLRQVAIEAFSIIVGFTVYQTIRTPSVLIEIIDAHRAILSEVYLQLIRQTRKSRNTEICERTWRLLLVVCSLYGSTEESSLIVRANLAATAFSAVSPVQSIAQLAYLRYLSRSDAALAGVFRRSLDDVMLHPEKCSVVFGICISELLWRQRKVAEDVPIPLVLHELCEKILGFGASQAKHPFAIPPPPDLNSLIDRINLGHASFSDVPGLDACVGLLLRFLGALPMGLLSGSDILKMDGDNAVTVAELFPLVKKCGLAYLIGFLRRFVHAGAAVDELVEIFAPLLVRPEAAPGEKVRQVLGIGKSMIQQLIAKWSVAWIYPLKLN
jgi:hypothetical protein